ncbi:MAG: sulfatase-like hydrolase/transferase [Acidobacteriaceae bacterium]
MVAAVGLPTVPSTVASRLENFAAEGRTAASGSRHPKNVVLMICDDLGYGDLNCYGSQLPTPNLDRLAADGMRFTHCTSGHPICSAARGSLLTGRYAPRSHTLGVYWPFSKNGMDVDETTIANLFHDGGYRTKAIGKWHLGSLLPYLPTSRGFDSYYGVPWSDDMHPLPLMRDTAILEPHTDRALLTPRYTEEALSFINEKSDKPFFLYLAFSYPHDPANASPRFRGKSGFGLYGDAVEEIDWSVGEITRTLKKQNLLDDTLVIFTSDHGCWFQGDMGPLRGRKSSTFEGGFRVPFIAHWPAAIPRGTVSNAWTSNLDVLPTLSSLCGVSQPRLPLDGIDISSALLDRNEEFRRPAILYFTPFSGGAPMQGLDLHCARKGKWKLRLAQLTGEIYINDYTAGHESFWLPNTELYNLDADPGESYDVASLHPDIVQEIRKDVVAQMTTMPPEAQDAFAKLQKNLASSRTRIGETPIPPNMPHRSPAGSWPQH